MEHKIIINGYTGAIGIIFANLNSVIKTIYPEKDSLRGQNLNDLGTRKKAGKRSPKALGTLQLAPRVPALIINLKCRVWFYLNWRGIFLNGRYMGGILARCFNCYRLSSFVHRFSFRLKSSGTLFPLPAQ